jgi:hypothetical protein
MVNLWKFILTYTELTAIILGRQDQNKTKGSSRRFNRSRADSTVVIPGSCNLEMVWQDLRVFKDGNAKVFIFVNRTFALQAGL